VSFHGKHQIVCDPKPLTGRACFVNIICHCDAKRERPPIHHLAAPLRYIKALETMRQLRLKQSQTVKLCQVELRYLKENKDKAQQIRATVATKEAQLEASRDHVQQIEGRVQPLEVRGGGVMCVFVLYVLCVCFVSVLYVFFVCFMYAFVVCFMCVFYMCVFYVCLFYVFVCFICLCVFCVFYMRVYFVCFICVYFIYVCFIYVCILCVLYVYFIFVCFYVCVCVFYLFFSGSNV